MTEMELVGTLHTFKQIIGYKICGQLLRGVIFLSKLLWGAKEVLYLLARVIKYLLVNRRLCRYSHTLTATS
jgi:hypothetical protein